MTIQLLSFGPVSDHVPGGSFELPDNASVQELKTLLHVQFPGLQSLTYAVSVNRVMVQDEHGLKENDEVALLPPFSGG